MEPAAIRPRPRLSNRGSVTLPTFCHLQDRVHSCREGLPEFLRLSFPNHFTRSLFAPRSPLLNSSSTAPNGCLPPCRCDCSRGLLLVACDSPFDHLLREKPSRVRLLRSCDPAFVLIIVLFSLRKLGLVGVSMGGSSRSRSLMTSRADGSYACCLASDSPISSSRLYSARLALMCAVAVIAGKMTANACGTQGVATLLLIVGPPAIVYCWRESSTAMRMFGRVRSRRNLADRPVTPGLQ